MRKKLFKKDETPIDVLITNVLSEMDEKGPYSSEYPQLMTTLERLYEVKAKDGFNRVSSDTVAIVVGNLMGILLIVAYEQKHVMTSKGFTQIIRPK